MSEIMTSLNADMAKLPQWVQLWINVLMPLLLGSSIVLLFNAASRGLAIVSILLSLLGAVGVVVIYAQLGMVRLLGLGHVIFWLPLLLMVVNRLRSSPPAGVFKIAMGVLALTLAVALAFDIADVVRWVLGERGLVV